MGLAKDMRTCIEDLPFDGLGLFNAETDDVLENVQKNRTAARCLGIYPTYQQYPQLNQWHRPQKFQQEPQRQTSYVPYYKQQPYRGR